MTNPSPNVLVNGFAPPFIATPSATVTIQVAQQAGVQSWALSVIGTDELYSAPAITMTPATLSATLVIPNAGQALILKSTVYDANGNAYSTTFKVHTLTEGGFELGALNETNESSAFGWLKFINTLIRSS